MQTDMMKKAGAECEYSPQEIQELKKCAKDPVYFISNYIKVQHPTRGAIMFDLYPYQIKLIKEFQAGRFTICKVGRQMGKTASIAAYLLWYACFHFDKTILVASNKNSNAMEIMQRIIYAYEELPMWIKPGARYATKHSLEFDNGSRLFSQATTENTGRGLSISLLMLDELAFVPKRIQEEMWTSIAPTLSTGGSCIISSTPNGDDELFAQLWTGSKLGTNDFGYVEVDWDEHPDRTPAFRDEMIGKLGELKWKQEYECQFLSSDPLLISSIAMQNVKPQAPIWSDKGVNFWTDIKADSTYYVGIDIATGVGNDFATIQVLEFPSMIQAAEFRSNKCSIQQLYSIAKWLLKFIVAGGKNPHPQGKRPEVYWSYENNGVGAAFTTLFTNDDTFPDVYLMSDEKRFGLATTSKNKILSCIELKNLIEKQNGAITINSDTLLTELKNYVSTGKSYAAKPGATDDLIAAFLVIIQLLKKAAEFEPDVFNTMYNYEEYHVDGIDGDEFGDEPIPVVF